MDASGATIMKKLITVIVAACVSLASSAMLNWQSVAANAAEPRFEATYFYQTEDELKEKQVDFADMARYSRQIQSQIWKSLKSEDMAVSNGYLVVAVRADQAVAAWFDMTPALSEQQQEKISASLNKVRPFAVAQGSVVFGLQMSINTPKHTSKLRPAPAAWQEAKRKGLSENEIETLVAALWPAPSNGRKTP